MLGGFDRGLAVVVLAFVLALPTSAAAAFSQGAGATAAASRAIKTETQLRRAWSDPLRRRIDLGADIFLRDCRTGDPIRESPYPLVLNGHGHRIRQTCFEKRVLRQDGTGYLELRRVTLTRGGSDGPGAALTTRGELTFLDGVVEENLSEEPGGGLFSMRRVTVRGSRISGNLANDDGGGVYARRGGVQIYDSVVSNNLVDGSGGAVGSTGDILIVDSEVDGNTTDGDGGALYADEDGDVTVVRSLIDGSDADGPGGAIFTLEGDVAVLDSTLNGNRADDRGGAVSGEADVLIVNSTVARNLAVAHAGGGLWARHDLALINSTVTDNYAEGEGGGTLAAGRTTVLGSTVTNNIASVGANLGSAGLLRAFGSILGPADYREVTGDTRPTRRSCRVYKARSEGYNFLTDPSCELTHATDIVGTDPRLARLEDDPNGFVLTPFDGSPVRARIPSGACVARPPRRLPAGQLLARYVDWGSILAHDARGAPRDRGAPCDIGAVQSAPPPAAAASLAPRPGAPPPARVAASRPSAAVARARAGSRRQRAAGGRRARPARSVRGRLDALSRHVGRLDRASRRLDELLGCTTQLPVDQAGDIRHHWGFRYDERDGTGIDTRTALVLHRGAGRPDLRFLRVSRSRRCLSAAPDPNGTGEDARASAAQAAADAGSPARRLGALERTAAHVDRRTERFDRWESCITWLPVTEAGDDDQDLGYLRKPSPESRLRHSAAIDFDTSEWDDPDYTLAAFVGRDRPFGRRECDTEPGENGIRLLPRQRPRASAAAASAATASASAGDAAAPEGEFGERLEELEEDVEDLGEPVEEITQFDECMYTVGAQSRRGFVYQDRRRSRTRRSALSFDMRGLHPAQVDLMAFSGEEPPQIECNEDAGGEDTEGRGD